jgi:lipopolysaccharide biosynthesis regulator YciM
MDMFATKTMADIYEAKGQYDQAITCLVKIDTRVREFLPRMKPQDKAAWEATLAQSLKKQAELKDKIAKAKIGPIRLQGNR